MTQVTSAAIAGPDACVFDGSDVGHVASLWAPLHAIPTSQVSLAAAWLTYRFSFPHTHAHTQALMLTKPQRLPPVRVARHSTCEVPLVCPSPSPVVSERGCQ